MDVATNLRTLLRERGMSANALSVAAGLNRDTVGQILKGRGAHPRADTIAKLARALNVDPAALITGSVTRAQAALGLEEIYLPVRHVVAAGLWSEAEDYHNQTEPERIPVQQIRPYAAISQWLERVVGDSMDRLVPPGSFVHVVDAIQLEYEPRQDDLVVVERTRAQGALIERSLKQIAITPEGLQLWPRSHNPRWDKPLDLASGADADDEVVQVVGLVIRSYMMFGGRE